MLKQPNIFICTNNLPANSFAGGNIVQPACIASFTMAADVNFLEARCLIGGQRQITASKINETVYTVTLSFENVDFNSLELALGEFAADAVGANLTLPTLKATTVVLDGGDGVINDAEITAGTADSIRVYLSTPASTSSVKYGYMTKVAVAPAADGEFQVDDGANRLVFTANQVGSVVQYTIDKTYTSIRGIGLAEGGTPYDNLTFSGVLFGTNDEDGYQIVLPRLTRISEPSIAVTGDLQTLEIEYRAEVPSGSRKPYKLFDLSTAV